jgi:hypothetical protein
LAGMIARQTIGNHNFHRGLPNRLAIDSNQQQSNGALFIVTWHNNRNEGQWNSFLADGGANQGLVIGSFTTKTAPP